MWVSQGQAGGRPFEKNCIRGAKKEFLSGMRKDLRLSKLLTTKARVSLRIITWTAG